MLHVTLVYLKGDPPPYSRVVAGLETEEDTRHPRGPSTMRGRDESGTSVVVRTSTSSDDSVAHRAGRIVTPPPPYEVAQRQVGILQVFLINMFDRKLVMR